MSLRTLALLVLSSLPLSTAWAAPLEIVPFQTANRSPAVSIYGLPAPGTAILLDAGETGAELATETVQNFAKNESGAEESMFDGETYRFDLTVRHGIAGRFEAGIAVPYLMHRGGSLDNFVENFHDTFGLPQGGRDRVPQDRLLYSYSDRGRDEILVDDDAEGFGDLRLLAAWQLCKNLDGPPRGVALHASLKLPTGDSDDLLGSGSTDLALWAAGSHGWATGYGDVALFGTAGLLGMTDGDVIPDRQNNLVAFGMLGGGWRPLDWLVAKVQLDTHTPFYDSDLKDLGNPSFQLTSGFDFAVGERTALEIGLSEDIAPETAPDVVFRVAVRSRF